MMVLLFENKSFMRKLWVYQECSIKSGMFYKVGGNWQNTGSEGYQILYHQQNSSSINFISNSRSVWNACGKLLHTH